ncbi:NAD(P)H-quinone oxidoreductase [Dyadobacter arcticus]|uniref:PIG3 family NAD(P)H quinone oxidoreductase n=1 Tax=Dyadobacter arcticus TaxID=1078754 RepID=A0ABX0UQN8_9BACT|nr:NAD(P)H-quinone oxidoreductase [Dyadobacter arcticus]NIJ55291.1 putative PIG3 family NAD(P)H quinone oxidoreductase [Dyadobacter arcticus]
MKAVVITSSGDPDVLCMQYREIPVLAENEILIKVYAAGVNRPDILQRKGKYPPPPDASKDVPGLEIAGIIEQVGDGVIDWEQGDQVCALLTGGGYAEYAIANAGHCLPIPNGFDFVQAASLPETVSTVWHNVFQRGNLQSGENFLVHGGSSGIGITAIQLAKAFGAKVFTTAGSDSKCDACNALGSDLSINYKTEDFEEILKESGVDVILDMVGGDYIPKNIRLLRRDGRLVFINTMNGNIANGIDFGLIMRNRLTITGSTLRNREPEFKAALAKEIKEKVWPIIDSGHFQPVIYKQFPMSAASDAHTLMESSEHIGKIVLVNDWD